MTRETGPDDTRALELLRWNLDNLSARPMDIYPPREILGLIRTVDELPALPQTARRLMQLLEDPDADAGDLADVVETDPLLASQLVRWANSAYYGLRQPVDSVKEAISRALGFEQAASLALGLIALNPLQTPDAGVVGRDAVMRNALRNSRLLLELNRLLPSHKRQASGLLQLCGVTQNIGYLLLGHLLPTALAFLNDLLSHNPGIELPVAENFALGVEHSQLGFWLMENWDMPAPVQNAIRHHHNPRYEGDQESLVLLNCLADRLLSQAGAGLGPVADESETLGLMQRLGLTSEQCQDALANAVGGD
jgi:HD-like signal output (HDOD) protein